MNSISKQPHIFKIEFLSLFILLWLKRLETKEVNTKIKTLIFITKHFLYSFVKFFPNGFGQLSFCNNCKLFYLKFSSVLIELTHKEFKAFHLVVKDIDTNYWDKINKHSNECRIYPISTSQQNLVLIFNKSELQALKELVLITKSENNNYASIFDINQKK